MGILLETKVVGSNSIAVTLQSALLLKKNKDIYDYIFRFDGELVLTLSKRRPLSYRNQSIDLLRKSMDWFLYDNGLRLERVKTSVTA